MKQSKIEARRLLRPPRRPARPDRAPHRPRRLHRGLCGHPARRHARHRHQLPAASGTSTRAWIIARPMTGFAETFSQYIMEVAPGGGSDRPEPDAGAEGVLFVVEGEITLTVDGETHRLAAGRLRLPAARLRLDACATTATSPARFHWIRKAYEAVEGHRRCPRPFVANEQDDRARRRCPTPTALGDDALRRPDRPAPRHARHHRHPRSPAPSFPFEETHVMEHGLYVLEGKAVYRLNRDWVEVEAGDFMWLRAFCPQACYAGGPGPLPLPALQGRQPPPEAEARAMSVAAATRTLSAEPLTAAAFAPFGDVIEAAGAQLPDQRRHVRPLPRPGADGVHRRRPRRHQRRLRPALSAAADLLDCVERHPLGSQAFVPMPRTRSSSSSRPTRAAARARPRAFLTAPGQGVNYLRNVWHGVLTPLGRPGRFLIVDRVGDREQPRGIYLRRAVDGGPGGGRRRLIPEKDGPGTIVPGRAFARRVREQQHRPARTAVGTDFDATAPASAPRPAREDVDEMTARGFRRPSGARVGEGPCERRGFRLSPP